MKTAVGFIGLGTMGASMAMNVIRKGFPLIITTSSNKKGNDFEKAGATVVSTPSEVAQNARIIVTCVPDIFAMKTIVSGPDGIASRKWHNGLLLDCSTISPSEILELSTLLSGVGARVIDAPVSGGNKGARNGTLTIMCGGEKLFVERAREVLEAMGTNIHHVGPLGSGQTLKACNQLMVAINMMGAYEAIALARAAGIDPTLMREVLSTGAARSGVLEGHALRYIDNDLQGGFRAELLNKDLGIAKSTGDQLKCIQPATILAHQLIQATCNGGFSNLDSAALGLLYDRLNGISDEDKA
ncbi:2-hydroxy-3-oxopropionate reductase [Chromohalobacter japonicus]|uniref:2-hydroxy-3-oxopropionate reductase n=1 Tax=Chromohalobacter japonicus TaxID=223900 RepID=A0A1Q8TFC0_9GAMM|nr:NAD(P)-dependent oxidoreductase [Chromohalobacter japonicus]OLO12387.1 2-hydroxy-3-oxopropionate reductase [Chromohalobacter japonicus]